jgi:hypothetical protein
MHIVVIWLVVLLPGLFGGSGRFDLIQLRLHTRKRRLHLMLDVAYSAAPERLRSEAGARTGLKLMDRCELESHGLEAYGQV